MTPHSDITDQNAATGAGMSKHAKFPVDLTKMADVLLGSRGAKLAGHRHTSDC